MTNSRECAIDYRRKGFMPIPIPIGSKNPNRQGWQKESYTVEEIRATFPADSNVGLLTGEPSGGLVDVDLDWLEARKLAPYLLPATLMSGRNEVPESHYWYVCDPLPHTTKYQDPTLINSDQRAMIVELRSTGAQTIVYPSIHPTGDKYMWHKWRDPERIAGHELRILVSRLAAGALISRHWQKGRRHDMALAIAGGLLRSGWKAEQVDRFIIAAAVAADDEEWQQRTLNVRTTLERLNNREKVTGWPKLTELVDKRIVERLIEWLDLTSGSFSNSSEQGKRSEEASVIRHRCLADVQPEKVSWLWNPYIPKSKLTIVEGDPGVGKSRATCALATATAVGSGPQGWSTSEPSNVLMLSVEDGLSDTIRPRLDSMRADVKRIFAIEGALTLDDNGTLTLEAEIIDLKPSIVIIDPLVAYIGARVDLHRANEVRGVTARLALLAEKYGCAVIAVRHLTKSGKDRAIYRGIGSIDFTAAARSGLLVGTDPDNPSRRAIIQTKNNLAEFGKAIGYEIREGQFFWTGVSNLTAERILSASSNESESSAQSEAESFLHTALAEGPRPSKEVRKDAREAGISDATLRRAKNAIGVTAQPKGQSGKRGADFWEWSLPENDSVAQGSFSEQVNQNRDNEVPQTTAKSSVNNSSSVAQDLVVQDSNEQLNEAEEWGEV